MNLKKIKKITFILIGIFSLSGCTATYNLNISSNNISESLNINGVSIDSSNYFIPVYYNSISTDQYDVDTNQKIDGIEYYKTSSSSNNFNLDYNFTNDDFLKSNIANTFVSSFVFKKYDYDDDGKKDYYVISTTDDFSAFNLYNELNEVTIKITNNHEVISNNADEVDGNIYIWHFKPNNTSSINMVYNPDVIVDNRTFLQKIQSGEYTNIFTISILLFLIGTIVFIAIKKIGDKRDKI